MTKYVMPEGSIFDTALLIEGLFVKVVTLTIFVSPFMLIIPSGEVSLNTTLVLVLAVIDSVVSPPENVPPVMVAVTFIMV